MAPRIPFFGRRQNRESEVPPYNQQQQQQQYQQQYQQQREDAPPNPGLLAYMPAVDDDRDSPPSGRNTTFPACHLDLQGLGKMGEVGYHTRMSFASFPNLLLVIKLDSFHSLGSRSNFESC
ncbi:uncharacterized protein L199_005488 [Kwoniella botswanensis]|uniref:uncharacterized protein n=1 Tax=Kwoniella botswanensis TaxID=1268659 RepID=UPI00315CAF2C